MSPQNVLNFKFCLLGNRDDKKCYREDKIEIEIFSSNCAIRSSSITIKELRANKMAKPLHIQRLEKALDLGPFMNYAETVLSKNDDIQSESDDEQLRRQTYKDKELMFNAENVGEDRKWLLNLLLSDTESDSEVSDVDKYIGEMLKEHKREKKIRERYHRNPSVSNLYLQLFQ